MIIRDRFRGVLPVVFLAGVAGLLSSGCGGYSSPTGSSTTPGTPANSNAVVVTINGLDGNMSFSPNPAVVKVGQQVVWRNADSITHHVVQDSSSGGGGQYSVGILASSGFDTGQLTAGATSSPITFGTASTIPYHCGIHPSMVGTLTVTP